MAAIPAQAHRARRDRLRGLLARECPGGVLLVTHLPNVRYLSGFSGSNAVLVVGPEPIDDTLGTDGRYVDQVAAESPDLPVIVDRDTLETVLARISASRVAVESSMSVGEAAQVRERTGDPAVLDSLVEGLRMIKDEAELDALARACAITVEAFAALASEMRAGQSERALARRLEQLFGELGAEDRAFDTIVGSGPHSAIPHHQPGGRLLEPGDLVVVDAGARVDGYHADMTRTFLVGGSAQPWQAEIHEVVARAQAAATAACRAGTPAIEVDGVAREIVAGAGLGERFTHGLGHGVGLEIHEAPMVGSRSTGTIASDMAITVEPGVYLPGRGGVRIEDTLVVADTGPRILTEAPRGLLTVG
jgi:Xaa-Pro aminopeptidase